MNATHASWWSTICAHFAADRRKTGVLAVMTVVMLIVWGRLLFKSDPSIAAAGQFGIVPELVAAPVDAVPGGASASPVAEPAADAVRPLVAPVDVSGAPRELDRELFAADWRSFPPALSTQPGDSDDLRPPGIWARLRAASRAEAARQRRRVEQIRQDAAGLVLQSTVIGRDPTAVISGRLVRPGDRLDAFEVVEIGPGRAVVRKAGVRVVLAIP